MKIKPLADRVLVKNDKAETKTAGGLIIPEAAQEKTQTAKVVEVGPGTDDIADPTKLSAGMSQEASAAEVFGVAPQMAEKVLKKSRISTMQSRETLFLRTSLSTRTARLISLTSLSQRTHVSLIRLTTSRTLSARFQQHLMQRTSSSSQLMHSEFFLLSLS